MAFVTELHLQASADAALSCKTGRPVTRGDHTKAQKTAFVYVTNIRWTAECYPFGVGTSKKNTFAMLGVRQNPRPDKNKNVHEAGRSEACVAM